ncbi:MAG: ABC-2 family transporter protein [Bacilli bacterium]|nr:ABC-2 family transporter protein [Bacilli bacterium]
MKSYISYFKLKFITGLQYRAAALAGISTQIFFGIVYISVYVAFYESDSSNLPMELSQLVTYLWLNQSLFALVYLWYKDKDILGLIKTGNIAYELCRPQNLYLMWASKLLGERLSKVLLRFSPVIIFALLLPSPFNIDLSITLPRFLLFLVTLVLSTILMTVLVLLYHIICLFTLDEKGIVNMFMVMSDILSGLTIPIPFFPSYLQKITNILPFRYVSDFPFRLYVGNITMNEGFIGIIVQLIWIVILIIIGNLLMKKALKKAVIQGG